MFRGGRSSWINFAQWNPSLLCPWTATISASMAIVFLATVVLASVMNINWQNQLNMWCKDLHLCLLPYVYLPILYPDSLLPSLPTFPFMFLLSWPGHLLLPMSHKYTQTQLWSHLFPHKTGRISSNVPAYWDDFSLSWSFKATPEWGSGTAGLLDSLYPHTEMIHL